MFHFLWNLSLFSFLSNLIVFFSVFFQNLQNSTVFKRPRPFCWCSKNKFNVKKQVSFYIWAFSIKFLILWGLICLVFPNNDCANFCEMLHACCDWGGICPLPQKPFIGSNSPRFNPQVNTDIRYGLGINLDSTVKGQLSEDEYQRVGTIFKFQQQFRQLAAIQVTVKWISKMGRRRIRGVSSDEIFLRYEYLDILIFR